MFVIVVITSFVLIRITYGLELFMITIGTCFQRAGIKVHLNKKNVDRAIQIMIDLEIAELAQMIRQERITALKQGAVST